MSQNREPPAFQEYAAAMLSTIPFRTMKLQDRGLLYTMRLECWVNERLPSDASDLAKMLGFSAAEVSASLSAVMPFFKEVNGYIICPELENYRVYLAERRHKQSLGGKRGSAMTNRRRNNPTRSLEDELSSTSSSTSRPTPRGRCESSVQHRVVQQNQNQQSESALDDSFVAEYEAAEVAARDP